MGGTLLGQEVPDSESCEQGRHGEKQSTAPPRMAEKGSESYACGYEILIWMQQKVRSSPKGNNLCFLLLSQPTCSFAVDPLAGLKEMAIPFAPVPFIPPACFPNISHHPRGSVGGRRSVLLSVSGVLSACDQI